MAFHQYTILIFRNSKACSPIFFSSLYTNGLIYQTWDSPLYILRRVRYNSKKILGFVFCFMVFFVFFRGGGGGGGGGGGVGGCLLLFFLAPDVLACFV